MAEGNSSSVSAGQLSYDGTSEFTTRPDPIVDGGSNNMNRHLNTMLISPHSKEKAEPEERGKSRTKTPPSGDVSARARNTVNEVILSPIYMHCFGLLLLIYNEGEKNNLLTGIREGTAKLKKKFESLGFAVIWLENPTSDYLTSVLEYLSSEEAIQNFPESFTYFFTYITCHGYLLNFCTKDGFISYDLVVKMAKPLQKRFKLSAFFFDCCKVNNDDKVDRLPESFMDPNILIVYAASKGEVNFGPLNDLSFFGKNILELIGKNYTLDNLMKALRRRNPALTTPSHDTTRFKVCLVEECAKRMQPKISQVTLSEDNIIADLFVISPPSVNPEIFPDKKYQVQIKYSNFDQWKTLHTISSKLLPDLSPGTEQLALTVRLPMDHPDGKTHFRVKKILSRDLTLTSEEYVIANLGSVARPKVTKKTLIFRDCQHPRPIVTFELFLPNILLQGFTVCIFKNGDRNPVSHQSNSLDSSYKQSVRFSCTPKPEGFSLSDLFDHKCGDRYEVIVEVEEKSTGRENREKITSDCVPMVIEEVAPNLDSINFSQDGAVVFAQISFHSSLIDDTFNEDNFKLLMKVGSSPSIVLSRIQSTSLSSSSQPVACSSSSRQNSCVIPLLESASLQNRMDSQHGSISSLSSSSESIDLKIISISAALPQDHQRQEGVMAQFRVVSQRRGFLSLPSKHQSAVLPPLVKPRISTRPRPRIHLSASNSPLAEVEWENAETFGSHYSRFSVQIFEDETNCDPIHTECFDYNPDENRHRHSFSVPALTDIENIGRCKVAIKMKLVTNEEINSEYIHFQINKGCCYDNQWSFERLRNYLCVLAIFLLLVIFSFSFAGMLVKFSADDLKQEVQFNSSWSPEFQVFGLQIPSSSIEFLEVNPNSWTVHKAPNSEISLYCDCYHTNVLSNNQRVEYSEPFKQRDQTLAVNTNRLLPLGSPIPYALYALSQSYFSVGLCLSSGSYPLPSIQLELHKRVDPDTPIVEKNPAIASVNVTFDDNFCSNSTVTVPSQESSVVMLSLSTKDEVHFKSINVSVKQLYYNSTALKIMNESNLIKTGKEIPCLADSKLMCYVSRVGESEIDYQAVQVSAHLKWKLAYFVGFIVGLALCLFLIIVVCIILCYKTKCGCRCCSPYEQMK